MNRLFFDLYNCGENYLLLKNLKDNPIKSQDFLRNEFFKRKLYILIDKNINNVRKDLKANKNINADYYLIMYSLYTDLYNLRIINSSKSNKIKIKDQLRYSLKGENI